VESVSLFLRVERLCSCIYVQKIINCVVSDITGVEYCRNCNKAVCFLAKMRNESSCSFVDFRKLKHILFDYTAGNSIHHRSGFSRHKTPLRIVTLLFVSTA